MIYSFFPVDDDRLACFDQMLPRGIIDLAGEDGEPLVIGASDEAGSCVGVCVLSLYNEGAAQIMYIYVREDARRNGVASGMIGLVSPILLRGGITRLFMILANEKGDVPQEDLKAFSDALGARHELITDHIVTLPASEILKKLGRKTDDCAPLSEVPPFMFDPVLDMMDDAVCRRISYFIDKTDGPAYSAFDPVSCAIMDSFELENMLIFIPRTDERGVVLIYMLGTSAVSLGRMMSYSIQRTMDAYGPDALVTFAVLNNIGLGMGQIFDDTGSRIEAYRAVIDLDNDQ